MLASFLRAGELTPIVIPDERDEAIRDLCRAREDAVSARLKARHRLKAMLLRHGYRYPGKGGWTATYDRFLARVSFGHPAQDIAFAEYRNAVVESFKQVDRLTDALRDQISTWRWQPVVSALMTMRGIDFIAAATLVSEIGDMSRFDRPKRLMSFLGLVPSEYSTGETRFQGRITKCGNAHVRRILIEAAWNYRYPARMSRGITERQVGQPSNIRETAWRAQLRLCGRYRRMRLRGVNANKICVAVARELSGFIWDVARQVPAPSK
ncbi:transposase IS116/IS110/IS902 family protein [Lysobacter antibioticus]|uniref:Transposase IS116/IS110/IS902 family protein n=2 Tax=Lysobacter antibioticus TaxID=84531 RepID=A0A0S2FHX4_LYSAN|nr:transposase IS116/IS110/IS902 family protein [Lysobacter antibioticus]